MPSSLIRLFSFVLFLGIHSRAQRDETLTPGIYANDIPITGRSSKSSFDAQFHRGRCPDYFYQLGDECVYFDTTGRNYAWNQAQRSCAHRIAQFFAQKTVSMIGHSHVHPTRSARQLVLNTPEKTKILEALYRDYDELHYGIRLPSDYLSLTRCRDQKDDDWPPFCQTPSTSNATCFETSGVGFDHICLRQVDCDKDRIRLTCEFTLPGSPELTGSKFRHCPNVRNLPLRLSIWAWLLIAVGAMLLLLLILGGVLAFLRNSKAEQLAQRKLHSTIAHTDQQETRTSSTRHDTVTEPILHRNGASRDEPDSDYLEPIPVVRRLSLPNLAKPEKQDDRDAYV